MSNGFSCVRSTNVPFRSSIITEFFFTIVSVSEADMIIPVTVASVNFKKSFIMLIVFLSQLIIKLTKINN